MSPPCSSNMPRPGAQRWPRTAIPRPGILSPAHGPPPPAEVANRFIRPPPLGQQKTPLGISRISKSPGCRVIPCFSNQISTVQAVRTTPPSPVRGKLSNSCPETGFLFPPGAWAWWGPNDSTPFWRNWGSTASIAVGPNAGRFAPSPLPPFPARFPFPPNDAGF